MANKESILVKKSFYDTRISEGELRDIIALAESLRQYDVSRNDVTRIPLYDPHTDFTLSTAVDIGKQIGLDGYVERAINSRYVSNETKISDLKEHQATPTVDGYVRIYRNELSKALVDFPGDKVIFTDLSKNYSKDVRKFLVQQDSKKGFFHKKSTLADFQFDLSGLELFIVIYDPLFLRTCSSTLKKLKDKLNHSEYSIEHEYPIDIE